MQTNHSSPNIRSFRPRLRDLGLAPGILSPGPQNAITDVSGVSVGHFTLIEGDAIRTGATALLPHGGNVYQEKVPAGVVMGNGFGKLMGSTQIAELGEIETPIVLTNTMSVPRAADAILDWVLALPGNERVYSVNMVVGETNDSRLNDIRRRTLTPEMIGEAIRAAASGTSERQIVEGQTIDEGAIGAGTGTVAFGWKGGIGTSSRRLPAQSDGDSSDRHTVGVLVQSNFGGVLQILGAPVGQELGQYYGKGSLDQGDADGSIMIVVATDLPLSAHNLTRLARRALAGLARTGASMSNGSGDYVLAFSTAESVRRTPQRRNQIAVISDLPNELMSGAFQAVIECTEEAILNSLFRAETMTGNGKTVEALPLDATIEVLKRYGQIN